MNYEQKYGAYLAKAEAALQVAMHKTLGKNLKFRRLRLTV